MKFLITADWHIDNYSDYNHYPNFRLDQFLKLAHRVVEIGKEQDCKVLVIAGDFINRPVLRPFLQHRVKEIVEVLESGFEHIYYILGQHSTDSKSDELSEHDTVLTIFESEKFQYMNHKVLDFNGYRIGFQNWTHSQDTSWIEEKLDVLIGHYTKSDLFGQSIDESKFDLMIYGDIHQKGFYDNKFVSVGTPIQKDFTSQKEGTAVVLDIDNHTWKHIETDEDHSRFLRMYYTKNKVEEGFSEDKLSYFVYKPERVEASKKQETELLSWTKIDDLISQAATEGGLGDIYQEVVSKCVAYSEIDFNFQPTYLDVQGYRSVVSFRIEFEGNDRVVLLGKNGSGKSSIIRASKSVLENSRYIAHEKSDLCPIQKVTMGLFYQNKMYEIWKGDAYGLKIDGEQQVYNKKADFEADLLDKLPFLRFIDLFFITSDVHNLSERFTPDRRIELISKFYRLDRIDAYSVTSNNLYQGKIAESSELKTKVTTESGIRDHIKKRMDELQEEVKDFSIEELRSTLASYGQMRTDNELFRTWQNESTRLSDRKTTLTDTVTTYKGRLGINIESSRADLTTAGNDIANYKNLIETTTKRWSLYEEQSSRLASQKKVGMGLKEQLEKILNGKCPTCDGPISNEKSEKLKSEINAKLDEVRAECQNLIDKLKGYTDEEKKENHFKDLIAELKKKLSDAETERGLLNNKISQYEIAKGDYDNEVLKLKKIEEEIAQHDSKKPKEVKLPLNLSELEYDVTSKISKYDEYEKEVASYNEKCKLIEELTEEYNKLLEEAQRYKDFSELTQRNGKIYEEILKKLADGFSESDIQYKVDSGVFRNNRFVKFNSFYKVKDKLRIYESLSDGQRTVCDLDFLSKLFSVQVGLLVMDEHLKALDEHNLPKAGEILSRMNVNTILISTHDSNFSHYTRRLLLELNEKGETVSRLL